MLGEKCPKYELSSFRQTKILHFTAGNATKMSLMKVKQTFFIQMHVKELDNEYKVRLYDLTMFEAPSGNVWNCA